MRSCTVILVLCLVTCAALPQVTSKDANAPQAATPDVGQLLEQKVRQEWQAFKDKDKKKYADLLAEDFVAVETDGEGARNKTHAVNEIDRSPLRNYALQNFRLITAAPNAAIVTYEVTMEFPPKSTVRFLRVWISELWLNRDGQWRARYYQETRVR